VKRAHEGPCIRADYGDPNCRDRGLIPCRLVRLASRAGTHAKFQFCKLMFRPRDTGERGRIHSLGMGAAASGYQAACGQTRLSGS
jgi:hypothetical protein